MSQWFYNKDGQAHGPIEFEELAELVKSGELGPLDQVFQTGATEWLVVSQCPELEEYLKPDEPEGVSEDGGPKEWVVLKKTQSGGEKGYKQSGPFTKQKVLELIDAGEVQFADFAWRAGMESWVPLNQLDSFRDPLPSSPPVDPGPLPGKCRVFRR